MKKITFVTLFLYVCVFSASAQTQNNTTSGPVWRVTYYRILPGKMNEVMMALRKDNRPIYEEAQKQGVIVDYKIYTNSTTSSSDDWNLAVAFAYKNWGALDGSGLNAIALKHFGSQEKMDAASANLLQLMRLLASKLIREQVLNPLP